MNRWIVTPFVLFALATACAAPDVVQTPSSTATANGDPSTAGTQPGTRVDPRKGGLDVGFGEWAIELEADVVRPGPITFVVRNGGTMTHGFEMEIEGQDSSGHGSGDGLKLEANAFGPGDIVRVHADLAPGVYKIECFIANHDDLGMETLLTVRKDAPLVRVQETAPDTVLVHGFAFAPTDLEVPLGTEVTWMNHDPTTHTVTADDGSFDSGPLDGGASFSTPLTEAGEFTYACQIHPTMTGTVTVVG
ncbi:MAG TPA: plastocyanin/azurin family copper-binding protein [Actinomycetota bacterium]|jgi:plastocyanin